jgi:protease I
MASTPDDIFKPETQLDDAGISVLILTADGTEDQEFFYPYYRFIAEGYKVDVATPDGGEFKGKNGAGLKETLAIADLGDVTQYDLLYIPGGKAPAKLREVDAAIDAVQRFAESGKPIAAICHGGQLLAAADVITGRVISGYPEIENEIREAGASFVSEEACVDGQFITARWPGDLPAHVNATIDAVQRAGTMTAQNTSPRANYPYTTTSW